VSAIHLTFDDGPDPEWTPRLLDELARANAPATFFVLSSRAACHPALVERVRAEGHEVGLHGNLHLRHDEHPDATVATDTDEALQLLAPLRPRLWRPPNGIVADITRTLAERHALSLVHWTADSVDWQADRGATEMLAWLEPQLEEGAIVLLHDAVGPGATRRSPAPTVELVGPLIAAARERGLEPALLP
jgi:peptidoglycan/xylan/chitin deacetylase (PgdA/CDA1 family)